MSRTRELELDTFLRDIKEHVCEVFHDDGVYRHLRIRKPGTGCMHYDLVTYPGYLVFTGDMGSYTFSRLHDMFEFFRDHRNTKSELKINPGYWGEKLQAVDRGDGFKKFSPELFKQQVMEAIEHRGLVGKLGHGLREQLDDEVLYYAECEHDAYQAVRDFEFNDKRVFEDFDYDCEDYSYRFLWCCYAIAYGILLYDERIAP